MGNQTTSVTHFSAGAEDMHYINRNIPCQHACPVYTNIPAYIRAIFERRNDNAYEINRMANIFPGVLGRICSRPCELACRHGESELGESVSICHLKRAAADFRESNQETVRIDSLATGRSFAIVGAGPAGLAAAHDLALAGARVTVFEAFDKPGGMLTYGIPAFRLPRDIIFAEIDHVLELGVRLRTGIRIGQDISVETLLRDFDAVLMAIGCYRANSLGVPGEDLNGIYYGLDFMIDVCSGRLPAVGKRVLVVGAGFTAFDCARSALRLGAEEVTICLRRTEQDLVVTAEEIHETKVEGVKIESLMLSQRVLGEGAVEGVEFLRVRPGELRSDGKRSVSPIEGSNSVITADTVIIATGQHQEKLPVPGETDKWGVPIADQNSFRTSEPRLYVAGDYLTGPSTVIEAIAQGRNAAESMLRNVTGKPFLEQTIRLELASITDRRRSWDFIPPPEMPTLSHSSRLKSPDSEVETGFDCDPALEHAKRCYLCYLHYEIDMDRCIYCRFCIDVAPRNCIKMVKEIRIEEDGAIMDIVETTVWHEVNAITIDNSRCIRCGECVRVCPVDCISVTKVELVERHATGHEMSPLGFAPAEGH